MSNRESAHQLIDELPDEHIPDAVAALEAIESDALLLVALRERHPEKTEAELLETLAAMKRALEVTDELHEHLADVPSAGIAPTAVEAVRQLRRERDAKRRTRRASSSGRTRTRPAKPDAK